jgi:methylenetetrahydrofolate dehydrogenase (NADP+) / methenyltetrahydrofolate cyclohydrolase
MSATILDGKALSERMRTGIRQDIDTLAAKHGRRPGLAVILVGNDPASEIYVRNKKNACQAVGIESFSYEEPDTITQQHLLGMVGELNRNPLVDGILVQLPLPAHIDPESVIEAIKPDKDVDGFHPYNIGRLAARIPAMRSCTPYGCMKLLEETGLDLYGKEAVVVGASNHVGRPMALELLLAGCTVTVTHRFTADLESHVRRADIVVAAAGKKELVKGEWIRSGAVVIDIGMHRDEAGKLCGDVEFAAAAERAGWITPVPGGVGPMTITMLLANTVDAFRQHMGEPA